MKTINSFAQTVKEEIVSKKYSDERLLAILSSFARVTGSIIIRNKSEIISLKISNPKIAKFIYSSIQKTLKITPTISYLKRPNLNKNTCYIISFKNNCVLDQLHLDFLEEKIHRDFIKNNEVIGGYLAGVFLASGSVNTPRNSNYHLEVSMNSQNYAKWIIHLLNKYDGTHFDAKIIKRRDRYIVYLKRSDQISDFLILIGATEACLYFENERVDRDLANITNRYQNLDTANYQKIVMRANKDIVIIQKLIKKYGYAELGSEKTILLCEMRIKYPEASLDELAKIMSKDLKTNISKSNVNHLLRAIRTRGNNV